MDPQNAPTSGSEDRRFPFKNPNYKKSKSSDKKRAWKSLKQIIMLEKSMAWNKDSVHYSSIDAPPPLKPTKKYSDISGFIAKYKDPTTSLYYSNSDEYLVVSSLPSDIISGYLNLRKALSSV